MLWWDQSVRQVPAFLLAKGTGCGCTSLSAPGNEDDSDHRDDWDNDGCSCLVTALQMKAIMMRKVGDVTSEVLTIRSDAIVQWWYHDNDSKIMIPQWWWWWGGGGYQGGEYVTSEVLTIRSDTINRRRGIPNRIAPSVLSSTTVTPWHHTMTPQYNDTMTLQCHDAINRRYGIPNRVYPYQWHIPLEIVWKICWWRIFSTIKSSFWSKRCLMPFYVSYICVQCTPWSQCFWNLTTILICLYILVLYMVCRARDQGVPTWTDCLRGASSPRQKGIVHFGPRGKSTYWPGTQWRICWILPVQLLHSYTCYTY